MRRRRSRRTLGYDLFRERRGSGHWGRYADPSEILDEGMALAQKIYAENQGPIDRLAAKLMLQPITLDDPVEIHSIAWPNGTGPTKNQENPHG